MAESIDEMLNTIKREYQDDHTSQSSSSQSPLTDLHHSTLENSVSENLTPGNSDPRNNASSSDGSSATVTPSSGRRPNSPQPRPQSSSQKSIGALLTEIGMPSSQASSPPSPTPFSTVRSSVPSPSSHSTSQASSTASANHLLAGVKAQYAADKAAAEQKQQVALEAESRRQQKLEEQRRTEQLNLAQKWLKNLDPHSDEGFWFESFATNYPSKLDAALDYLEAIDTSHQNK